MGNRNQRKRRDEPVSEKPAAMKRIEHRGCTAVQSPRNFHVMIGRNGKVVYHSQCDHLLSDDELREMVDRYLVSAMGAGAV